MPCLCSSHLLSLCIFPSPCFRTAFFISKCNAIPSAREGQRVWGQRVKVCALTKLGVRVMIPIHRCGAGAADVHGKHLENCTASHSCQGAWRVITEAPGSTPWTELPHGDWILFSLCLEPSMDTAHAAHQFERWPLRIGCKGEGRA